MNPPLHACSRFWRILLAATVALFTNAADTRAATTNRPNVVLILADDLGARDLGCYGADLHETPNLDRLAREGICFTRAYAPSPVCSPTRASLLTGKHPARLHLTIWSEGAMQPPTNRMLLPAQSLHALPATEITLARHLQGAGYLAALIGKWHLGDADRYPETHGFDVNIGGTRWGAPATYFFPYRGSGRFGAETRYVPHLEFGSSGEYLTDRLTDEALRVMDRAAAARQPFFLYLAHHAPHTPIEAKTNEVARFAERIRPGFTHQNPVYAAMVKSLDDSVGRVLARLRELDLETNTLVIFTSDNGGYIGTDARQSIPVTTNAPLRSGKGSLYEGGLRVPLLLRWPGVTRPGAICDDAVVLTDLFPTIMDAVGLALPDGVPCDGLNLAALLRDPSARLQRETLCFHYPHYYHAPTTTPVSAILSGPWKLIERFEDQQVELFNLRDDPAESRDLADEKASQAAKLRQRLHEWQKTTGAGLPRRNPGWKSTSIP